MELYCRQQVEMNLYYEWKEKVMEDGIFDEYGEEKDWQIKADNAMEFIESLGLEAVLTEEDIMTLLQKQTEKRDEDGNVYMTFDEAVKGLTSLLYFERKLPLSELVKDNSNTTTLPVDRINKFLKLIKKDFELRI